MNLRDVILVGNSGPCQGETSDKELGRLAVDAVCTVFCGLSVVSADTAKRGLVASSVGQVPYTEYPTCEYK